MMQMNEADLEAYLQKREQRLYGRLLLNRFFRATVTAVNASVSPVQVQVQRQGESASDGNWYSVANPGCFPVVGDQVEMVWRDAVTAYVLWRLGSGPAHCARAYLNAGQTVSAGTQNPVVAIDTSGGVTSAPAPYSFDPLGLMDLTNHQFVCKAAGFYGCAALVSAGYNANPTTFQANVTLNTNTAVVNGTGYLLRGETTGDLMASGIFAKKAVWMNVGDTLQLRISVVAGNPTVLNTGPASCWFEAWLEST